MQTIFQLIDEVTLTRDHYPDAFGVNCVSKSNPANYHYVIMRNEQEFESYKAFYKDYDFKFNVVSR